MRRGGTAAETNVAEKKGEKTIKLLASKAAVRRSRDDIQPLFDILPSPGLPSLFV